MSKLKEFIEQWFPKTEEWNNVAKFILESGVELVEEQNQKWLPGYTNISQSHKPHHKDEYVRFMEEQMFMLHDTIHQLFTITTNCSEEEYMERQINGELFVFYLTEYLIPLSWDEKYSRYIDDIRDCHWLMYDILQECPDNTNVIDWMWAVFIDEKYVYTLNQEALRKYRKMFKEDLENSRKNYKFVKDLNIERDCCIVGASSQNHIDFFEAVKKGAIKNIKREFSLKLPEQWI
jgi:hypothetical protein